MFGIGFFELVLIAVAVLVVVGPQKMPDVMRQAGKLFVQLRRTANDVRGTFDSVIRDAEDELRREEQAALKELLAAKAALTATNTVNTTATQITDAAHAAPHPDTPAGAVSMADPHAPVAPVTAPATQSTPAPHPAVPNEVTHSQPATEPAPAPHPAGPDSIAGHADSAADKS